MYDTHERGFEMRMKSNFFKYIFIIFAIGITIFAVYKIRKDEENKTYHAENENTTKAEEKITQIKLAIAEMDTINPILSKNKNVQDVSKLIFEPLLTLNTEYKIEPCLATEWAKVSETSYLIKLKSNVKWSNGETFTAEDVRYTIDRLKEIDSIYAYNVQYVIGVDVVDNNTVRINLDREIPFFEYNLTFPIMCSTYYKDKDFLDTETNKSPIGTGPYKITQVEPTYITLEKNDNWWNKTNTNVVLEKITVNLYTSVGEMYNSFKMGNVDLISTSNNNLQEYIGTIGYSSKEMKGREHDFIAINTDNYILSKPEVRKAISYSIDKDNIVSSVYNNKYITSSFPLDFGSWLYTNIESSSGYNVEQAKQILIDNGWEYKYNYWQKYENYRTQRISLSLVVKASDSNKVAVGENIKSQLEAQGFRINLIRASDSQYNNYLTNKNYDLILCSIYVSASPNLNTYFGENNLANYENEEVNSILEEVKNTTDETILKEKYKRLEEIYKSDVPYISLYNNKYTVAYNSELVGEITPNWYYLFYNICSWYK